MTGELEGLVAEYPLRERLWRLLVLALYRAERQADALAAYRRARDMLAEELGLEPGEDLRRLEQAVLRQEVLAAPAPARHNLPAPLTSFLGREQDLAKLDRLLRETRLVTLTGTGGTGKTRLALETGARVAGLFPDGVWLAELAGIADPGLVAAQVMQALGVRQQGDVPVLEALVYRLRSAELLLILDNCEHLLDACAQLAGVLLRAAPGLRVLATSREPLGLPGEVVCPVQPLDLPPETAEAREAGQAAAVRLFLDRGSAARGGTADGVAVAVAERICRKLDGLPLAIELAAARLGTLSAAEIEARLADRFRFLAYRRPGADPRHQALRAAMDWSYELRSRNPPACRLVYRTCRIEGVANSYTYALDRISLTVALIVNSALSFISRARRMTLRRVSVAACFSRAGTEVAPFVLCGGILLPCRRVRAGSCPSYGCVIKISDHRSCGLPLSGPQVAGCSSAGRGLAGSR